MRSSSSNVAAVETAAATSSSGSSNTRADAGKEIKTPTAVEGQAVKKQRSKRKIILFYSFHYE